MKTLCVPPSNFRTLSPGSEIAVLVHKEKPFNSRVAIYKGCFQKRDNFPCPSFWLSLYPSSSGSSSSLRHLFSCLWDSKSIAGRVSLVAIDTCSWMDFGKCLLIN